MNRELAQLIVAYEGPAGGSGEPSRDHQAHMAAIIDCAKECGSEWAVQLHQEWMPPGPRRAAEDFLFGDDCRASQKMSDVDFAKHAKKADRKYLRYLMSHTKDHPRLVILWAISREHPGDAECVILGRTYTLGQEKRMIKMAEAIGEHGAAALLRKRPRQRKEARAKKVDDWIDAANHKPL